MNRHAWILAATGLLWIAPAQQKKGFAPPIQPKPEELQRLKAMTDELETLLKPVKARRGEEHLVADVDVYLKAGRFLLEFPETFFTQAGIDHAMAVAGQGIERARQLASGQTPWTAGKGRKIHGYYSALDGSVQPYGVTIPESYDGSKPVRLYVWLHGRNQTLSEANFIFGFPQRSKSPTYVTADVGQITIDCYGRWNNANHWAGEVDVFEAIRAVQQRYKIDPERIILRGFSLGGAGAWHIALHHPSFFAAAEIGAGTYPRRSTMPGFPPHQAATLRIWENIIDWSLNAQALPIAGHDGDNDTGVAAIPPDPPGTRHRGQLESSLRVRGQLEKEGFVSEGDPDFLRVKGTPSVFLISLNTGHSVSPLVRQRVDGFLKEHGDRGRVSPDHVRFVTYTARYNRSHWISVDGLEQHYERAEVNARRANGRTAFDITTKNVSRLAVREVNGAAVIRIDGQEVKGKGPAVDLEKAAGRWRMAKGKPAGLRKSHALQGPIDDAFLDPFLLVRPTGTPWNQAAHDQAMRILARFDRVYARWYRSHPRIKDDKDVTDADFARYNVALFGDPGSNRWIAKVAGKLPVKWSRDSIQAGAASYSGADHLPVLVYPNPLRPGKYVVINSGLTIDEREYQSDYSMPKLGDWAVLKTGQAEVPEAAAAGLFDEEWRLKAVVRTPPRW